MGHIGSLAAPVALPSVAPPAGAQLGQALGQLPQMIQDAQMRALILQQAQGKADDENLQKLVTEAQGNPQILESPQARNFLSQYYGKRKLPVPLDANGKVDLNAIVPSDPQRDNATLASLGQAALVNPAVLANPTNEATITRILGARGLDAESFKKDGKWDPTALAALQPETAGVTERVMTSVQGVLKQIADPKSPLPVAAAMAQLKAMGPQITVAFRNPEAMSTLVDPQVQSALEQRADLAAQALTTLNIIKPQQEIEYKQKLLDIDEQKVGLRAAEDATTKQYKMGMLSVAQGNLSARMQAVQTSAGRLAVYAQQVSGQLDNARNATAVRSMSALMDAQGKLLSTAQNDYTHAAEAWQNAVNNGYTPDQNSPLYQAMVSAKSALDTANANVARYQTLLEAYPTAAANAITPQTSRVEPVGGAGTRQFSTSKSGKPIYSDDGQHWYYVSQ